MRNFPPPPPDPRKTPDNDSPWTMMYIIGGLFTVVICFIFGVIYFNSDDSAVTKETGIAQRILGLEGDTEKKPVRDDFPACRVSYRFVESLTDTALKAKALQLQAASANVFDYIVRMRRGYRKVLELNDGSEDATNKFMLADQNAQQLRAVLQEYITTGLRITGETTDEMSDGYYNILRVPGRYIEERGNNESKIEGDPVQYYFTGSSRDAFFAFNLLLSEVREFERNRFYTLFPER
jgi:hypothetical protein